MAALAFCGALAACQAAGRTGRPGVSGAPPSAREPLSAARPEPAPVPLLPDAQGPTRNHVVARGETLFGIARRYAVDPWALAEMNGIADPARLAVGTVLAVPGSGRALAVPHQPMAAPPLVGLAPAVPEAAPPSWAWPVATRLVIERAGSHRAADGLLIRAEVGTPVQPVAAGRVVDVLAPGPTREGVVVVKHEGMYTSRYANVSAPGIMPGAFIDQGEILGAVGPAGSYLHVTIRRGEIPVHPLAVLP